jgi:hypothetical protein
VALTVVHIDPGAGATVVTAPAVALYSLPVAAAPWRPGARRRGRGRRDRPLVDTLHDGVDRRAPWARSGSRPLVPAMACAALTLSSTRRSRAASGGRDAFALMVGDT